MPGDFGGLWSAGRRRQRALSVTSPRRSARIMRQCVLVVARDATLRSTLARWLMPAGYSVELAENDRRAREILADRRVALTFVVARTRDGAGASIFDPGENGGRLIIASERPEEPGRLTRS